MNTYLETDTAPSTVVMTFATSASAGEVWRALTEPTLVACWFGTLTTALRLGEKVHLDFGDGDFFTLEVTRTEPPYLLEYTWRFLGIGPLEAITWRIASKDSGCLVTVIDNEPDRSPEVALLLKEGWLDFTQRLEQFLTTGSVHRELRRFEWRRFKQ